MDQIGTKAANPKRRRPENDLASPLPASERTDIRTIWGAYPLEQGQPAAPGHNRDHLGTGYATERGDILEVLILKE